VFAAYNIPIIINSGATNLLFRYSLVPQKLQRTVDAAVATVASVQQEECDLRVKFLKEVAAELPPVAAGRAFHQG